MKNCQEMTLKDVWSMLDRKSKLKGPQHKQTHQKIGSLIGEQEVWTIKSSIK